MSTDNTGQHLHFRLSEFTTRREEFWRHGPDGPHVFEIKEGLSAEIAIDIAGNLDASIRHCMLRAVSEPLNEQLAYLLWFASEAAQSLRSAAGVEM
jgi:hypothetical protein